VSLLVNVLVFTPLALGLLLWFCFPPRTGSATQEPPHRSAANPVHESREK
jgi:hypothetical protein